MSVVDPVPCVNKRFVDSVEICIYIDAESFADGLSDGIGNSVDFIRSPYYFDDLGVDGVQGRRPVQDIRIGRILLEFLLDEFNQGCRRFL